MSEKTVASTQYDDLQGTIAVDGHDGSLLQDLAAKSDLKKGYFPIGLTYYSEFPGDGSPGQIYLLAIDEDRIQEYGSVMHYASQAGPVRVLRFRVHMKAAEVLRHIKRANIILADKVLAGKDLNIVDLPDAS